MKRILIKSYSYVLRILPIVIIAGLAKIIILADEYHGTEDFLIVLITGVVTVGILILLIKKLKQSDHREAYGNDLLLISNALIDRANLGVRRMVGMLLWFFLLCGNISLYVGVFASLAALVIRQESRRELAGIGVGSLNGFIFGMIFLSFMAGVFSLILWIAYGFSAKQKSV